MAQRKKIYQALIHTQYSLVDTFIVGFGSAGRTYVQEGKLEYHQTYPIRDNILEFGGFCKPAQGHWLK